MNHVLIHLALALVTAQLVHGLAEAWSARMKLARLSAYIRQEPWKEMPVNVDTRAKAFAFAGTVFLILSAIFFGIFTAIDPTGNIVLVLVIVLAVLAYWSELIGFDRFHVDIETITRRFRGPAE